MPSQVLPQPAREPFAPLIAGADKFCSLFVLAAATAGLTIGGSNLAVWVCGPTHIIHFFPSLVVMRVNSCLATILASLSLALWRSPSPARSRIRAAQVLGLLAALIGGMTAWQDICQVDLGIDHWFPSTFKGDLANAYTAHPGRMSLNAALSFWYLGLALATLDCEWTAKRGKFYVAPALALLSSLPAALALVGYLLGVGTFTGILRSTNILLHAAATLFVLSIGVLAARPRRLPTCLILSPGADGTLLRWLLPGATVVMLTMARTTTWLRNAEYIAAGESTALMLYGGMVLLFALLVSASRAVSRQESRARRAIAATLAEEARSRAILNTSLDAVLLMDAEGRVTDWNPAAERMFGWRRDEVIGQSLAQLIIPEALREAHARGLERYLQKGEGPILGQRLELTSLRRDGTEFPVEISINLLPRTQQPLFVGFVRDITDRKAVENDLREAKEVAETASHAKDNFLAALSHELRTPLTPVLLNLASMRSDMRLPVEAHADLAMMERNILLEARLIDDLLDLTRISHGKLELRSEACDLHAVLAHAAEIVHEDVVAREVKLTLTLGALRSGITGDAGRLQQVFWNLLKNAVKFSPAGSHIIISTRDENEFLVVEVIDTGLGFAPENAEELFKRFEQGERKGDHRFGGLGLGLAIARAIVELHSGTICAVSKGAGRGATFTVRLPGASSPPVATGPAQSLPQAESAGARSLRLLVVDDHEPTLNVLTKLLRHSGHHVVAAASLATAKTAAAAGDFDVVISDLGLPDGTGQELMASLAAQYPHLKGIALSGYGMSDDIERSRKAGFAMHLTKPVNFQQLHHVLRGMAAQ